MSNVDQNPVKLLELEGVSISQSGREVLHDVTFDIYKGKFIGLIGTNGSGKTTLLRAILGIISPSSGHIRFLNSSKQGRSRNIGYVPQKIDFDPDMPLRARDLVALGLDGNRLGISKRKKSDKLLIDSLVEQVGAADFANSRVGELSGGEQQRIMIAHALISKPELILLDEPLANLDLRSQVEIVTLVSKLAREGNITVLISTHDMNPLLPVMDRILYIANGKVASGEVSEVVTTESLSSLYGHHVEVVNLKGRILVVPEIEEGGFNFLRGIPGNEDH
ncbi:MAG: ABC transporter ATP-binding protein [Acidimicrobiales bacterium]|nr:ABC transporter ATP-binding protein [Acidimicrobiales bacterium]